MIWLWDSLIQRLQGYKKVLNLDFKKIFLRISKIDDLINILIQDYESCQKDSDYFATQSLWNCHNKNILDIEKFWKRIMSNPVTNTRIKQPEKTAKVQFLMV